MDIIPIIAVFSAAAIYLLYREVMEVQDDSALARHATAVSEYVVSMFVAIYGSVLASVVLASPLLLLNPGEDFFSRLVDRPYFPLQTAIAAILGVFVAGRLRGGRPAFVWVLPFGLFCAALFFFASHHNVLQSYWVEVWYRFFDLDCGCSATLVQWEVMLPLYTSIAFSVGACLRNARVRAVPNPVTSDTQQTS